LREIADPSDFVLAAPSLDASVGDKRFRSATAAND